MVEPVWVTRWKNKDDGREARIRNIKVSVVISLKLQNVTLAILPWWRIEFSKWIGSLYWVFVKKRIVSSIFFSSVKCFCLLLGWIYPVGESRSDSSRSLPRVVAAAQTERLGWFLVEIDFECLFWFVDSTLLVESEVGDLRYCRWILYSNSYF